MQDLSALNVGNLPRWVTQNNPPAKKIGQSDVSFSDIGACDPNRRSVLPIPEGTTLATDKGRS